MNVVLRMDDGTRPGTVHGEVESRYGREAFSGWLELLGQLEALVDRARGDPARYRFQSGPHGDEDVHTG